MPPARIRSPFQGGELFALLDLSLFKTTETTARTCVKIFVGTVDAATSLMRRPLGNVSLL